MLAGKGYSEHTAELIDEEVSKLIRTNEERTKFILAEHRDELDSIAAALLEKESLSEQDLIELLGHPAAKK